MKPSIALKTSVMLMTRSAQLGSKSARAFLMLDGTLRKSSDHTGQVHDLDDPVRRSRWVCRQLCQRLAVVGIEDHQRFRELLFGRRMTRLVDDFYRVRSLGNDAFMQNMDFAERTPISIERFTP